MGKKKIDTRHNNKREIKEKYTPETAGQTKTTVSQQEETEAQKADTKTGKTVIDELEVDEAETAAEKEPGELSLEDKFTALNEKYLRLFAEYDNYRKRTEREKSELISTASEMLIMELLPILDNLDRATEHKNNKTSFEEYVKGIAIIEEHIRTVLSKVGLEPIEVVGKPFDPAYHDAVMQVETDEYDPGIVSIEVEKGYILSGKVIRHPKVIVSK